MSAKMGIVLLHEDVHPRSRPARARSPSRRRRGPAWLVVLASALAACTSPGAGDVALPQHEEIVLDSGEQAELDIQEILRELELANTNDDVDAVIALYAEDAMWSMPDGSTVRGAGALRQTYADLFKAYDVTMDLHVAAVELEGQTARVMGNMTVQLRILGQDEAQKMRDRFIMVLRQDGEGGEWRIWRLAWTSASGGEG